MFLDWGIVEGQSHSDIGQLPRSATSLLTRYIQSNHSRTCTDAFNLKHHSLHDGNQYISHDKTKASLSTINPGVQRVSAVVGTQMS